LSQSEFQELLAREFDVHGALTSDQLAKLDSHYQLLLQWNAKLNLTRITSLEDAVRLHYCESLFAGLQLPQGETRIADVGSGAGFPGIPIAILRPEYSVTLIESHQRKAVFLREAGRELPNIRVLAARAEDVAERFDWVVSRAVDPKYVLKLRLAPQVAFLGNDPEGSRKLPWGRDRYLKVFHVEHFS